MKKIRGDKPVGVIIYLYMEISLQTSKFFPFFLFFLYKIREQESGTGPAPGGGGAVERRGGGERGRRVNTVQILCTHVCKCKNDTY
jgi:hypothetical protein